MQSRLQKAIQTALAALEAALSVHVCIGQSVKPDYGNRRNPSFTGVGLKRPALF